MDTPPSTVGPGIGAFIAFFALALALWLLMRNMNGRMRRMAYREQQRVAELEAPAGRRPPRTGKRKARRDTEASTPPPQPAPEGPPDDPQTEPDTPTP